MVRRLSWKQAPHRSCLARQTVDRRRTDDPLNPCFFHGCLRCSHPCRSFQTAYRHDTVSKALLYCAMACCLLWWVCWFHTIRRNIVSFSFLYGAAIAAFSCCKASPPTASCIGFGVPTMGGWITAPPRNHNHYAGLWTPGADLLVLSLTCLAEERERIAAESRPPSAVTIFLSGSWEA
jgi:hypothetical protein